jgi:hypothetical protein
LTISTRKREASVVAICSSGQMKNPINDEERENGHSQRMRRGAV